MSELSCQNFFPLYKKRNSLTRPFLIKLWQELKKFQLQFYTINNYVVIIMLFKFKRFHADVRITHDTTVTHLHYFKSLHIKQLFWDWIYMLSWFFLRNYPPQVIFLKNLRLPNFRIHLLLWTNIRVRKNETSGFQEMKIDEILTLFFISVTS